MQSSLHALELPGPNAGSLVSHLFPGTQGGAPGMVNVVGEVQALIVLIGWGVLGAAAGGLLFWRRDVA